jgi:hypothetical protein
VSDQLLDPELKTLLSFFPPLNLDRETLPIVRGMIGKGVAHRNRSRHK